MTAGAVRTLIGQLADMRFDEKDVRELKNISVSGPLPCYKGKLFFPAPADIFVYESSSGSEVQRNHVRLRPSQMKPHEGTYPPLSVSPILITNDDKPADSAAFWSSDVMGNWLADLDIVTPPKEQNIDDGYMPPLKQDIRTHVKIDPKLYAAEESMLFSTSGLDFTVQGSTEPLEVSLRVETDRGETAEKLATLGLFNPLGGERRLTLWRGQPNPGWTPPQPVNEAFGKGVQAVRLILATPAVYRDGWRPDWIAPSDNVGIPPHSNVTLKLMSAIVNRWQPVSGFSFERGKTGPKPIRRMVPSGSVYFFKVMQGNPMDLLRDCWLRSTCSGPEVANDGFGLGLWGAWRI
jgi:CRISPR-associated protein Cmr3